MTYERHPAERRRTTDRGRSQLSRYVHSGGFNRLKGRPTAPGSVLPGRLVSKRRRMLVAVTLILLLIGGYFIWF